MYLSSPLEGRYAEDLCDLSLSKPALPAHWRYYIPLREVKIPELKQEPHELTELQYAKTDLKNYYPSKFFTSLVCPELVK